MDKIKQWFERNNLQITWFQVGFFISQAFVAFSVGNWEGASLALVFAGAIYYINQS